MNTYKIITVYKKEIVDSLRDRRTLLIMLLIPMLLYPTLIAFAAHIQTAGKAMLERQMSTVAIVGQAPQELYSLVKSDSLVRLVTTEDAMQDLKEGTISAFMEMVNPAIGDSMRIYYDGAVDRSSLALERLRKAAERFRSMYRHNTLQSIGIDTKIMDRYSTAEFNIAPPDRMGSYVLGMLIPMMLIMTIVLGAMYPAIDLTAGEKERGTMETILSVPINKTDLFIGKYLTVCTIAMITACINLLSMLLTFSVGFIQLGSAAGVTTFTLTPLAIGTIFALMLPLAMLASAIFLTGSIFSRSFKDAQNLMTPILLVLMLPTIVAATPGIELSGAMTLVPILNLSLLLKEILLNNFNLNFILLVFFSNSVFAIAAVVIASSAFSREETLLGDSKGMNLSFQRKKTV